MIQQCNTFLFTCISNVLITYVIYFIFTIILALLGAIFVYIIKNRAKVNWKITKVEYFLISYCIGISFYVFYGYVLDIFQFFNFFSAFLSIIIIDCVFLFYLFYNGKINEFKKSVKSINFKYLLIFFSLILFFEIYRVYIVYAISTSLESSDPYQWTASVWYLIDNQQMNHVWFDYRYPSGFTIFCAGYSYLAPSKTLIYYFMKIASMPLLTIILIGIVSLSHRLFQNFYLDFFCLLLALSANYFLTRIFSFISSSIATFFVLIILLIFLTKVPNWIIGILIPAIYLIHNLTALFLIAVFLIYYCIKTITERDKFKEIFQECLFVAVISLILLIPYFIHTYVFWEIDPIEFIYSQLVKFEPQVSDSVQIGTKPMLIQSYINEEDFLFLRIDKMHELAVRRTIGLFFFFSILGLFLRSRNLKKYNRNFVIQLKIGTILTVLFYYIPYLFNIEVILNNSIYSFAYLRFTETFAIHLIILSALFLDFLWGISKKIWRKMILKYKKLALYFKEHKIARKFVNLPNLIIFLIFFSSIAFFVARERFYYKYEHRYMGENLLYIVENVPSGSTIIVQDFDYDEDNLTHNRIFYLLYDYNIIYYNNTDFERYSEFSDFCIANNCSHVLIKKEEFDLRFQENLENSEELVKVFQECEGSSWFGVYELIS